MQSLQPRTPDSLSQLASKLICLHIISFLWLLVIQFSVANREGKLYWAINSLSIFPCICAVCFYSRCATEETNFRIKMFPTYVTMDSIVHFCYFIEVFMIFLQRSSTTGEIGVLFPLIITLALWIIFLNVLWQTWIYHDMKMKPVRRPSYLS